MVHGIQRNFLLPNTTLLENLQKDGIIFKIFKCETFYTKITHNQNIKFQNINDSFYKITTLDSRILEQNKEEKITQKNYENAKKKLINRSIKKKRYEFKLCSYKSLIDVYEEPKICILKIFFSTVVEADKFVLPREFNISKELHCSLDSKFIMLYGYEQLEFDIEKCFKIIEKNQNFTLEFPSYINAFDGSRIFLFYLFRRLKFYWNLTLENRKKEYFYEFFFYAKKIYIVLSSIEGIFEQKLCDSLALKFKALSNKAYQNLTDEDNDKLLLFLASEDMQNLFSDFDFFIRENSFYVGKDKDYFFKQIIANILRKKLIFLKKDLLKVSEIEKIEIRFLELFVFLEYFYTFFHIKSLDKIYKKYFHNFEKKTLSHSFRKKEKLCKLISKASKNLKIYKG